MRTIVYLINVDWFFVSHFLHLARRARGDGCDVILATHCDRHRTALEAEGITIVDLPARRAGLVPSGLRETIAVVARILKNNPNAILHGFGKFGILTGTFACRAQAPARRVYTITGRGYSAASQGLGMRLLGTSFRIFCRRAADQEQTRWIAENTADIAALGLERARGEGRVAVVGGAGVDPDVFSPAPLPPRPPLRAALVARLIWSKGVDVAITAVEMARARGANIELTLAGEPDPANPRSLSGDELRALDGRNGVRWIGRSDDVPALWASHHVALLPSRGGEGVPKSLIEAAACGRPIVTTQVPGCSELARATDGWIVRPGDAAALAECLISIAADEALEARGIAARNAILADYTEAAIWETTKRIYAGLGA